MTGLRPIRWESRAAGIVATAVQNAATTVVHEDPGRALSLFVIASARSRYGTDRTIRKALPPRMKKRDATRNRKLRSRRMSVPHASAAIDAPAPATPVLRPRAPR